MIVQSNVPTNASTHEIPSRVRNIGSFSGGKANKRENKITGYAILEIQIYTKMTQTSRQNKVGDTRMNTQRCSLHSNVDI